MIYCIFEASLGVVQSGSECFETARQLWRVVFECTLFGKDIRNGGSRR